MARVKGAVKTRARHKKILKLAKGYRGAKSKLFRTANQAVMKSLSYAYRDRKAKKREFRQLWIARINAAARMNGISYSKFMKSTERCLLKSRYPILKLLRALLIRLNNCFDLKILLRQS